jgi:hypothetical protein
MITASLLASTLILLFIGGVFVFVATKVPNPFNLFCQIVGWIIVAFAVLDFLLALLGHAPVLSI